MEQRKKDPYWSLWGLLKSYNKSFRLPNKKTNCFFYNGIIFCGNEKLKFTDDYHAVKFLKEMDNEVY